MSNDLAGMNLGLLEQARGGLVNKLKVENKALESGGGLGGGLVGTVGGGLLGLLARKGFRRFAAPGGAIGGGLLGRAAGAGAGRLAGTDIPTDVDQPLTPETISPVAKFVAKQGAVMQNKQALAPQALLRGLVGGAALGGTAGSLAKPGDLTTMARGVGAGTGAVAGAVGGAGAGAVGGGLLGASPLLAGLAMKALGRGRLKGLGDSVIKAQAPHGKSMMALGAGMGAGVGGLEGMRAGARMGDNVVSSLGGLNQPKTARQRAVKVAIARLKQSQYSESLVGGLADKKPDSAFSGSELHEGIEEEAEHTGDLKTRKEIAKDHLAEDPRYYTKLERMEEGRAAPAPTPKTANLLRELNKIARTIPVARQSAIKTAIARLKQGHSLESALRIAYPGKKAMERIRWANNIKLAAQAAR
jgi:hypothetical protein